MIAGTTFKMLPDSAVRELCAQARGVISDGEIDEIEAQCHSNGAAALACDDGAIIVTLKPLGEGQHEMFVWLGVAFRHGAFERQDAALRLIARDLGAERVGFCARRRGWARRLGPEWKRDGNHFSRSVV
jgi:hypothetical protein